MRGVVLAVCLAGWLGLWLSQPLAAQRPHPPGARGPGDRGPGDRGPGDRGPGDRGPGDRGPGDRGNWPRSYPPGFDGGRGGYSRALPPRGYYPYYGGYSYYSSPLGWPYLNGQVYGPNLNLPSWYWSSNSFSLRIPSPLGGAVYLNAPPPVLPPMGVVTNPVPGMIDSQSTQPAANQPTAEIVLRNPPTSGGRVHYSLNEFQYTINPGESQRIPADRSWTLRFDNGLGNTLSVPLQPDTTYYFQVSEQTGWDVLPAASEISVDD